jgi:hypothetical protein
LRSSRWPLSRLLNLQAVTIISQLVDLVVHPVDLVVHPVVVSEMEVVTKWFQSVDRPTKARMSIHNCWNKSDKFCCKKKVRLDQELAVLAFQANTELLNKAMAHHRLNMDHLPKQPLASLESNGKMFSKLCKSLNS